MKKLFTTFVCLLFVSFLYSQVTLDDVSEAKQFNKTTLKNNKPNSSNWISLSSGFSNYFGQSSYNDQIDRIHLISELTYSHRHFLNSNNFLSFDGGIYFEHKKARTILLNSINPNPYAIQDDKETILSLSLRVLYNYHFNRFSINTGFGTNLYSYIRYSIYLPNYYSTNYYYWEGSRDAFIDNTFSDYFFGIIGLNIQLNQNNELGIRTNYQLLKSFGGYGVAFRNFGLKNMVIFQLKYNHRI
jgi:hypothetical protein